MGHVSHSINADRGANFTELERELRPEQVLCHLLSKETGADISPMKMQDFIVRHWHKIEVCAHRIHDRATLPDGAAQTSKQTSGK